MGSDTLMPCMEHQRMEHFRSVSLQHVFLVKSYVTTMRCMMLVLQEATR